MLIIKNHQGIFGADKCKHFKVINYCFKKLPHKSDLIANVIPNILAIKYILLKKVAHKHIKRRRLFYSHPISTIIFKPHFEDFYINLLNNNEFNTKHIFLVKKNLKFNVINATF